MRYAAADAGARASWITPRLLGGSFPTGGRGRTRLGVAGPDVVISVCAMIVVFGSIRLWLEERRSQVLDRQTF